MIVLLVVTRKYAWESRQMIGHERSRRSTIDSYGDLSRYYYYYYYSWDNPSAVGVEIVTV